MKREDLYDAYKLDQDIRDCENTLFQLSNNNGVFIDIYTFPNGCKNTIRIQDDPEMIKLIVEYLETKKEKLERSLEKLL